MSNTLVISHKNLRYGDVRRYRGEVFALAGDPNDQKMISVGNFSKFEGDEEKLVVDPSGRRFTTESSARAFRVLEPNAPVAARTIDLNDRPVANTAPTAVRTPGRPGRPKRSVDSKPRQRALDKGAHSATARSLS